jgi:hypothetical protein
MDALQTLFIRAEQARSQTETRLAQLTQGFGDLAQKLGAEIESRAGQAEALARMAEGQERLIAALDRLADQGAADRDAAMDVDAEMRMRLRSIDLQMSRMLEEMSAGRQESMADLRNDFAALTRALMVRARGGEG